MRKPGFGLLKIALAVAAAAALAWAWQAAPAAVPGEVRVSSRPYAPHTATLRAQTNLVEVGVVVRDNAGHPQSGFTAADFQLFDQGKLQPITMFSVEAPPSAPAPTPSDDSHSASLALHPSSLPPPTYVALFFDDFSMTSIDLGMARNAAEKYIKAGVDVNLRLGVFTTSGAEQLDFTSDAARVAATLRRLAPQTRMSVRGLTPGAGLSPYLAYQVTQHDSRLSPDVQTAMARLRRGQQCFSPGMCYDMALAESQRTVAVAEGASKDTLGALERMIAYLGTRPGQRTLLLASSGFLTESLQARQDAVADAALRAGVVIDTLDAKLLETEPPGQSPLESSMQMAERDDMNDVLATLADTTGGEFFHNNNDMAGALRHMASEPEVRYLLGFSPPEMAEDGKFHALKVKLAEGRHGQVQARKGYFDPTGEEDPFAQAPTAELDEEVLGAATSEAVPVKVGASGRRDPSGHSGLEVTVQVDTVHLPFAKADHLNRQRLFFVTAVFDANTDANNKFVAGKEGVMALALTDATLARFAATGVTARLSLPLPPGRYRLREVVRETQNGAATILDRTVEVQ